MHSFLDNLMPTVKRIEDAPEAFGTTLRSLMAWLKASSREANVHAFADAVTARVPELVGANLANTGAAPKEDRPESGQPADGPDGAEAAAVPNRSRRERPSSQTVKTSGPAEADNGGSPASPAAPDTAPAAGFAGFSQHVDQATTPSAPRAS